MSGNNVEIFLGTHIKAMKYLGLWRPENRNFLYLIYTCFSLGSVYIGQILFWMYLYTVWGDLEAMTDVINVMSAHLSICLKMSIIVVNNNNIRQLLDFMNCEIFSTQLLEHKKFLAEQARKMRHMYIIMLLVFNSSLIAFYSIPFFSQPRVFPYLMWMPVDPETSPGFEIGYAFQLYCGIFSTSAFPTIDFFIITLIIFSCVQLDIIKDKLKKIKSIPPTVTSDSLTSMDRQHLITENNKLLNECICQHQTVKRFIEAIHSLFNIVIFFQIAGTVEIICIIAFRLSVEPLNTIKFYSSLMYLINILSQLYFFCWSGNELTTRSEELRDALYQCPWYEQDPRFRRTLLIAMECMKRPIVFRAGYFVTLSRTTFVTILRCSYSYFAVLNQVNDNK